jgi:hypothetical protein
MGRSVRVSIFDDERYDHDRSGLPEGTATKTKISR